MYELTTSAKKGTLWLGTALGPESIGPAAAKGIALIIGKTKNGTISRGTGILFLPRIILTCAHVLDDMT
jgi:hypothetical protein